MPSKEAMVNAANTAPADRTSEQQNLVNLAYKVGDTEVKNVDHATQARVRTYGR